MSDNNVLLKTNIPGLELHSRGKVRDIYKVADELLIIATDRISAFDYILPTGIPRKGEVLTQLSLFWFDFFKDLLPPHIITANSALYPAPLPDYADQLAGRSMLVSKADMLSIECVARGYVSGSGWKDYQRTGAICGIALPEGLKQSDKLPEPIFTPATKADSGHDENISFEEAANLVGRETAEKVRDLTLDIYGRAADYARERGIIIADTKFEFGFIDGELVLADEVLTPDSSRFWPADKYQPGGAQPSFDKQYVRDYLESIHWDKQPPAPALPPDVARNTSEKYIEAYRTLSGKDL
ncbi:MAG: phosphoribosylaminoimidazolesuccinocarboxamide synthase [bacterium]|nr:phosphoribosylaminoimidazolesuccinocarboxamide synthase [bacterium]